MMSRDAHPSLALAIRAVVTLVLVAFVFLVPEVSGDVQALVVGAVVGYWLREGEGQALRNRRHTDGVRGARFHVRGTGSTATRTTSTAESRTETRSDDEGERHGELEHPR